MVKNGYRLLLGQRDGETIGIITIDLEGYEPYLAIEEREPQTGNSWKMVMQKGQNFQLDSVHCHQYGNFG